MDGHRDINSRSERTGPTDASLDREIESLLAVDPSPEFVARVRTRVAQEPWPGSWRMSWMFAAAGVVAVVIVTMVVWPSGEPTTPNGAPQPTPRAAQAVEMGTAQPSLRAPQPTSKLARARAGAVTAAPNRRAEIDLPEVLIAENEARTFARLLTSLRQDGFEAAVPELPNPDTPLEVRELPVEHIEIEPLVTLAALRTEGERP